MCSESLITSPRISFSHDIEDDDDDKGGVLELVEEDQEDSSLMDVSSIADHDHGQEFDFSFSDSFTFESSSSSAAELFSDGQIRPQHLEEKFVTTAKHTSIVLPPLTQHPSTNDHQSSNLPLTKKTNIATTITTDNTATSDFIESPEQKNQTNSRSFWKINRSSSVHCDNRKSSFWSLPLMLRSNSTGSVPSPRQKLKENRKQMPKQLKNSNSSASSSSFYMYQLSQKPPLKKNSRGSYSNGVWINPVHNVPTPHIAKGTANLFGITSLFKEKKDKKAKK